MASNNSSPGRLRRTVARAARPGIAVAVLLVGAQVVLAAPPSGDWTVSPDPPVAGQAATFTATGVSDPDLDSVTVTWDFDFDGTTFTQDAIGPSVQHTFPAAGATPTVVMRLTDSNSEVTDVPKQVTVAAPPPPPNSPPTAAITVTTPPASRIVGQPVSFSGSGSSDPDPGDTLTYAWDLDNDGGFDDATGVTASQTYASEGSKTVRLQVSSRGGLTDDDSATFTVNPPPNNPPVPAFSFSPASPIPTQLVTFDASATTDDKPIPDANYDWTFGDGGVASGRNVQHAYATRGGKTVTLTVTDSDGVARLISKTVTVLNRDPVASFTYSPLQPPSGATITFTSTSSDPDGDPLTYAWDLDGDAATDFNDGTGKTAQASFPTSGGHPVRLRVRDGQGGESVLSDAVVVDNRPPVAAFLYSPAAPVTGETVQLTSTSNDPDGPIASQTWDLDGDGQFDDASGRVAAHSFATAGEHTVSLQVADPGGASNVKSLVITVRAAPDAVVAPLQLMSPFPIVRIVGRATPTGAKITRLSVSARKGASLNARCSGKGCPRRTRSMKTRSKGRLVRFKRLERRLRAGTKITIRIGYPGRIGKYTSFLIKRRVRPARRDLCLPPRARPTRCPST